MNNKQVTSNMDIHVDQLQQNRRVFNDVFDEGMVEDGVAPPSNQQQQQGRAIHPHFSHELPIPRNWSPAPVMIAPPTRRQPSHVARNFSPVVAPSTRRQPSQVGSNFSPEVAPPTRRQHRISGPPANTGRTYSLPYSTQRLLDLHKRTVVSRVPTPGIPAPPAAAPHQLTNDDRDAMLRARYGNLYRPLNGAPRGRPILGRKQ